MAADAAELELVRDTADRIAHRCREAAGDDHTGCWQALREAGFTELRDPDESGTPIATVQAASLVVERLARAVCGAPLVGHLLANELLRLGGATAGDEPHTVVLDEAWTALATGPGVAWDGALAKRGIAPAGSGIARLELGEPADTIDPTRPLRRTRGEGVAIGRLTAEALHDFESFARTLVAADMLGTASGIFDAAVEYVQQRVQFGKAVGSFQAVQHLCAEAYVQLEGLRSAVSAAELALDGPDAAAVSASMVAKSFAEEAAIGGVQTAIQLFGGIAITVEHPAHRHLRRVLLDRDAFGNAETLNDQLLEIEENQP